MISLVTQILKGWLLKARGSSVPLRPLLPLLGGVSPSQPTGSDPRGSNQAAASACLGGCDLGAGGRSPGAPTSRRPLAAPFPCCIPSRIIQNHSHTKVPLKPIISDLHKGGSSEILSIIYCILNHKTLLALAFFFKSKSNRGPWGAQGSSTCLRLRA